MAPATSLPPISSPLSTAPSISSPVSSPLSSSIILSSPTTFRAAEELENSDIDINAEEDIMYEDEDLMDSSSDEDSGYPTPAAP